jgi:hypothetical protein
MTCAVRFSRSYGSSSALVCAKSALNASGCVAWQQQRARSGEGDDELAVHAPDHRVVGEVRGAHPPATA